MNNYFSYLLLLIKHNPLQYSCPEDFHGQRSLEGYNQWDRKELDMTERLSTHTYTHTHTPHTQVTLKLDGRNQQPKAFSVSLTDLWFYQTPAGQFSSLFHALWVDDLSTGVIRRLCQTVNGVGLLSFPLW